MAVSVGKIDYEPGETYAQQSLQDSMCQVPYCKIAGTEVLNHKLGVYIAVPAAGCRVKLAK
jgi:hypothetical protein